MLGHRSPTRLCLVYWGKLGSPRQARQVWSTWGTPVSWTASSRPSSWPQSKYTHRHTHILYFNISIITECKCFFLSVLGDMFYLYTWTAPAHSWKTYSYFLLSLHTLRSVIYWCNRWWEKKITPYVKYNMLHCVFIVYMRLSPTEGGIRSQKLLGCVSASLV